MYHWSEIIESNQPLSKKARKATCLYLITLCLFVFVSMAPAQETMTMLSNYPSMQGSYYTLAFVPQDPPVCNTFNDFGKLYYDKNDNLMKACRDDGATIDFFPLGSTASSYWDRDTSTSPASLFPLNIGDFVGLGTATPEFMLTMEGADAGIIAEGSFGNGSIFSNASGGTMMFWYPKKSAFRAGQVTADQWDDPKIGNYSIAFGYNSLALGDYSGVGGGENNQATAAHSFVGGGKDNIASGAYSAVGGGQSNQATNSHAMIIGGWMNVASGQYACVGGGFGNNAISNHSIVGGGADNNTSALYSFIAGGQSNTASSEAVSVCGGESNTASGTWAVVAGGRNNNTSNQAAIVAGGQNNTASGFAAAVAGGKNNTASGDYSFVPGGQFNIAAGDYSWAGGKYMQLDLAADHTFVWGHAEAAPAMPITASDAFLIFPYGTPGKVGIRTGAPLVTLNVVGGVRVTGLDGTTGAESEIQMKVSPMFGGIVGTVASSQRYKKDIQSLVSVPGKVLELKPVEFTWKASGKKDIGLIAEDAAKVFPEIALRDQEGQISGVEYNKIAVYLIQTIKDLKAENEQLKSRMDQLRHR